MVPTNDIVEYARTWIGARWRHQGRGEGPDRGIDCVGLLYRTAVHFEMPVEDLIGYRRQPGKEFMRHIEKFSDRGRIDMNLNGAVGIFGDSVSPFHVGILAVDDQTGHTTVIHAEAHPKRRVHEQSFDAGTQSLRSRLLDVRLFRGVDYGQ